MSGGEKIREIKKKKMCAKIKKNYVKIKFP